MTGNCCKHLHSMKDNITKLSSQGTQYQTHEVRQVVYQKFRNIEGQRDIHGMFGLKTHPKTSVGKCVKISCIPLQKTFCGLCTAVTAANGCLDRCNHISYIRDGMHKMLDETHLHQHQGKRTTLYPTCKLQYLPIDRSASRIPYQ